MMRCRVGNKYPELFEPVTKCPVWTQGSASWALSIKPSESLNIFKCKFVLLEGDIIPGGGEYLAHV